MKKNGQYNFGNDGVPEELSEEYDVYVADAVELASGRLTPERERAMRERMRIDRMYRAVVEPIVESYKAPPLTDEEMAVRWAEFRRRAGLAQIEAVDDASDSEQAPPVELRLVKPESSRRTWRRPTVIALAVAAVLAAVILVPIGVGRAPVTPPLEYVVTASGSQYQTVELSDGSSVLLGPYSQIRYAERLNAANPRVVELRGQAVFTVAHRDGQPFIALTKLARVTAVGTKFLVVVSEPFTSVHVSEGKVMVQALDSLGQPRGRPVPASLGFNVRVTEKEGVLEDAQLAVPLNQGGVP